MRLREVIPQRLSQFPSPDGGIPRPPAAGRSGRGADKYRRVVALVGSCRITRCGRCFGETARCRSAKSVELVDRLCGLIDQNDAHENPLPPRLAIDSGGVKPTYLKDHGHEVLNPALPDDDFDAAVRIAQAEFDRHQPDVVVGFSRGGAVAMNIDSGDDAARPALPGLEAMGNGDDGEARHGRSCTPRPTRRFPFADSQELLRNSGLPESALIVVGTEHRLADPESLKAMLEAVERAVGQKE